MSIPSPRIPERQPVRAVARRPTAVVGLVVLALALAVSQSADAATQSFLARVDRSQVPLDASFIYEVTLVLDGGRATGYRPPRFSRFRVISERPSQSHQFQMGSGGTMQQTTYTWTYELAPTATGTFQIDPAHVNVEGAAARTAPVSITVQAAAGGQQQAPPGQARSGMPPSLFGQRRPPTPRGDGARNFMMAVASKDRVFVGEQLVVEWRLYLTERQDRYQPIQEPRTDGFWSEDIPIPSNARGLSLTQQEYQGRTYLMAPLFRKALYPLHNGTLVVSPYEAEVAQVDFFGTTLQTERLKTDPLSIVVMPLPDAGKPQAFDSAAVGVHEISVQVDRQQVEVGEAVTLTLVYSGVGNVRKLPLPTLDSARLPGFKIYDPKIAVDVTPGDVVAGRKRVEYLLLPERAGAVVLDPFRLPYFDPQDRTYRVAETAPITINVTGEAASAQNVTPAVAGTVASVPANDNILGGELRPIRGRNTLSRDLGSSLYRSRFFEVVVAFPPVTFFGLLLIGRVRSHLGRDTERGRSRKLRRQLRQRLGEAAKHLDAGQSGPFFIEVDLALRQVLSARFDKPVTGLARDELRRHLESRGVPAPLTGDVVAMLERCDEARFMPGEISAADMGETLSRAGDLLDHIERLPRGSRGSSTTTKGPAS